MRRLIVGLSIACLLASLLVAGCPKKEQPTSAPMPPGPSNVTSAPAPAPKSSPADLAALKVKNALVTNKEKLGIENLQVDAAGNVLTIRGSVKDAHLKALAGKLAAPVAGGMTIKNELQVSAK